MELKDNEPDAVVVLYNKEYPQFLRAAVKMDYISIRFQKSITEEQKAARSENGKQHTDDLKYQNK